MQTAIVVLMVLHGLVHAFGFMKAYRLAQLDDLKVPITPVVGMIWLLATALFIASAGLIAVEREAWWALAVVSVIVSQGLIASAWGDAKWGSIPNAIILLYVFAVW